MNRFDAASWLFGCAGALGVAALFGPGGLTLVAAPVAAALVFMASAARREIHRAMPPRWVAAGLIAAGAGAVSVLAGSPWTGILAFSAGLAAAFCGTQVALGFDTGDAEAPAPLSLATNAAVGADSTLLAAWQALGAFLGEPPTARVVEEVRTAVERHRAAGILDDPTLAHYAPPTLEKAHVSRRHLNGLGDVEQLSFESEFEDADPEVRDAYLAIAPNRIAQATMLRHRDGGRPALVCIHGLAGGVPAFDARLFGSRRLHRGLGLDIVQYTLPLHGHRSRGRVPGDGFLNGHPLVTNAAFAQALWDLRRIIGWLRAGGAPTVGVMGASLGGYTAAALAGLERGLACVVPLIPAVSLVPLIRRDRSPTERLALGAIGLTDALLAEAFAPHDPLRHRPRVAPEGRLIVAGRSDRVCPPEQAEALWRHWKRPAIHWFPGSHLMRSGAVDTAHRIDAHLFDTLLAAGTTPPTLTRFRARAGGPPRGSGQPE